MLIDIDHFKEINDTFGHPFGDRVLVAVTKALRSAVRTHDTVGRLGGEEFAMLVSGADLAGAHGSPSARALIADVEIPGAALSSSAGAAATSAGPERSGELFEAADRGAVTRPSASAADGQSGARGRTSAVGRWRRAAPAHRRRAAPAYRDDAPRHRQPVGIPVAGGAGWPPVYGVIGLLAVGSVVSGPPNRTILPPRIWPISAPVVAAVLRLACSGTGPVPAPSSEAPSC